ATALRGLDQSASTADGRTTDELKRSCLIDLDRFRSDRHTDTSTDPNPIAGIRNRGKTER
ncbi:hypothetical protein, partial [Micromonospora sp. CPCC 206061]|uniref:hypothetical protein n=1 Tax=Micromonospora sp. CPCC 206061 TaxID=3122410 RepID=UPI002FEEC74B